jgi:hypothetical protein
MSKQPYIPLYTGDYLKATRRLPLEVRGAWVDILIYMWENRERGTITGTIDEFASMLSCNIEQASFVIGLLQQKDVCDYELLKGGLIKLISRRMVREAEISEKRAGAGKKGMESRYSEICNNKTPNKTVTNSDIDNDIVIDTDNGIELKLKESLNEIYIDQQRPKWAHIDFDFELNSFLEKVRGSPDDYLTRDNSGIKLAFQYQLRNAKPKGKNGKPANKATEHANSLLEGYKRRNG